MNPLSFLSFFSFLLWNFQARFDDELIGCRVRIYADICRIRVDEPAAVGQARQPVKFALLDALKVVGSDAGFFGKFLERKAKFLSFARQMLSESFLFQFQRCLVHMHSPGKHRLHAKRGEAKKIHLLPDEFLFTANIRRER